ncbi:MAG TPA: DNA-3-methyladenine glycosylase 2 family protein [Streptosporangiaceae bacterium]
MPRRPVSRVLAGIPGGPQVVPYAAHGPRAGHPGPLPGAAVPPLAGALTRQWQPPFPLDWSRTLGVHRRGRGDPAYLVDEYSAAWRTSLTPEGPATMRVHAVDGGEPGRAVPGGEPGRAVPGGGPGRAVSGEETGRLTICASAWGPGAAWLLDSLPGLLGAADDPSGFEPVHPLLTEMSRRHHALRIGRSDRVFEALIPAVLEQKVVGAEAKRAWRLLLLRFGDPAPGPAPPGMRVCPPPQTWIRIPSWEWHRAGVELVRARTIIGAARVAGKLEETAAMTPAEADRRLQTLSGIGPWTSAEIRQRAIGDPDALSVGDYHLPSIVGWALIRQKVDDAGMCELLAPYAGHRYRAAWLLEMSGQGPPRHGPRNAPRDYRHI